MTERLLTVEEVADWLAIATRRVMDLAREREIPGFKVGKDWRFSREEIAAYLEEKRNIVRPSGNTTS